MICLKGNVLYFAAAPQQQEILEKTYQNHSIYCFFLSSKRGSRVKFVLAEKLKQSNPRGEFLLQVDSLDVTLILKEGKN